MAVVDHLVNPRAAIVGAGPSGFYAVDHLIRGGFAVDMYDILPSPYGLVRAGVAPDHPKIKSVTKVFDRIASHPSVRFFGGVEFGADVSRADLLQRYDAVVYAVGTELDSRLGIPGEGLSGSHPATHFVAWYNGHPAHFHRQFDLGCDHVVVIGNGNVALDVARMLVLDPAVLRTTDIADHAAEVLAKSQIRRVTVLGRRGPVQAAFSTPELHELADLRGVSVVVDPEDLVLDEHSAAELVAQGTNSPAARRMAVLRSFSEQPASGGTKRLDLRFLRSPLEILGDESGQRVTALRVVRNRIDRDDGGRMTAIPTGYTEDYPCGLVVRAIGYRGRPLPDVPFDGRRGIIRNSGGRVIADTGAPLPGEYVVGWIKRGPSGVIGTNKSDAQDTVARLLEDAEAGRLNRPALTDSGEILSWVRTRVPGAVDWAGWQAIDEHERRRGEPLGRPRVKVVDVAEMRTLARMSAS